MKPKSKAFNLVWSYFMITLASAIYAVGFNWFYVPNDIAFGGITGVGQIINAILPWAPIGTVVIILDPVSGKMIKKMVSQGDMDKEGKSLPAVIEECWKNFQKEGQKTA